MDLNDNVNRWITSLLDPTIGDNARIAATDATYRALRDLLGLEREGSDDAYSLRMPTFTDDGIALGLKDAALCLSEHQRTLIYVRGLAQAVAQKQAEGARPVQVLYAGCGPFATLCLPLTHRFSPDELQITLLDLHAEAVQGAVTVMERLGLEGYIAARTVADAVHHQLNPAAIPDIIVTETLQRALTKESQVSIVANLLNQTPTTTLMVPEEIVISGHLMDRVGEQMSTGKGSIAQARRQRVDLGPIFVLDQTRIRGWGSLTGRDTLPALKIIGQAPLSNRQEFCLLTRIRTFAEHWLMEYESSLTIPHPMPEVPIAPGEPLPFAYQLGKMPGLVFLGDQTTPMELKR